MFMEVIFIILKFYKFNFYKFFVYFLKDKILYYVIKSKEIMFIYNV